MKQAELRTALQVVMEQTQATWRDHEYGKCVACDRYVTMDNAMAEHSPDCRYVATNCWLSASIKALAEGSGNG